MAVVQNQPTEQDMKVELASLWWMPLVRGILLILFGILMYLQPVTTLLNLIWFMGLYWIVDGIFSLIEGVRGHTEKSRLWMFIGGIFSILGGIFIVGHPVIAGLLTGTFIVYLIGITSIIAGLMMIFAGRDGHWTWGGLIMGILYVIFGFFVLGNPIMTLTTLVWLLPIWAIISGVLAIVLAFQLRNLAKTEIA